MSENSEDKPGIDAIFCSAIDIDSREGRQSYLERVCGDDAQLRQQVERLLEAHYRGGSILDAPAVSPAETIDRSISEGPGTVIDRYKLLQQIGEGGFGVVYMAEQREPVHRKVALKIIKPGMDTKEVIARFEAERQALALMDHPNVARILDGGATHTGRPYFVMDLVRGVPITDFCDENNLPTDERLRLFVAVCNAVQHAHQKGIIHRDIKPNNVLVTLDDSGPVVKVIDFGVAKAIGRELTEKTLFTRFEQMIGTPLYMSPEQTEMRSHDVDTRADIYSLGVLLYELLTGTTPLEKERLREAGYEEICRIIRREDPPKPSTRISTLGQHLKVVSSHRQTEPAKLSALIRGDLDWVVMKALEKERGRRYKTADALAEDIQSHLADLPVDARPPSNIYRLNRFYRRNRAGVLVALAMLFLLLVAIGGTTTGWISAARNADLARKNAASARENAALARENAALANQHSETAKQEKQLAVRARGRLAEAICETAALAALMGNNELALKAADSAEEAEGPTASTNIVRGLVALNQGDYEEALTLADEVLENYPSSIGARSLRASASFQSGIGYTFEEDWLFLRKATPTSDTDRLLKAIALAQTNPSEAEATLGELRHSPVGLLVHAKTGYLRSIDQHKSAGMEKAVTDFEYLQHIFHESQGIMSWRLAALAAAIEFAKLEQRLDDVARHEKAGHEVARQTQIATDYAGYSRWLFYRAIGETQPATDSLAAVKNPRFIAWYLAADCLYRNGTSRAAMEEFEKTHPKSAYDTAHFRLAQAHLLRDLPDGEERTRDVLRGLTGHKSLLVARQALFALCLVETPEGIEKLAKDYLNSVGRDWDASKSLWGGSEIEYLAGHVTESDLLKRVEDSSYAKVSAHFAIAMHSLAERDRDTAVKHFAECVTTNAIFCEHYEMGRAYHERLMADPNWPQWLVGNRGDDGQD